jgi:hypothetical protein
LRKAPPTLKVRTSFNIVAGGATELSECDFSAEVEMRRAEGEGEVAILLSGPLREKGPARFGDEGGALPRRAGFGTARRSISTAMGARRSTRRPVRNDILKEIGKFRVRITALKAKGKGLALVRTDVEVLPGPGHIVGMAQSPQPYDLVTRPCTIDAGRFRWDIRENGRPIQSSMESFATEQEARADGRHELEKLILVSRL